MFLINPLEFLLQFEWSLYLFGAFGFLGVALSIQKLVFGKGV